MRGSGAPMCCRRTAWTSARCCCRPPCWRAWRPPASSDRRPSSCRRSRWAAAALVRSRYSYTHGELGSVSVAAPGDWRLSHWEDRFHFYQPLLATFVVPRNCTVKAGAGSRVKTSTASLLHVRLRVVVTSWISNVTLRRKRHNWFTLFF